MTCPVRSVSVVNALRQMRTKSNHEIDTLYFHERGVDLLRQRIAVHQTARIDGDGPAVFQVHIRDVPNTALLFVVEEAQNAGWTCTRIDNYMLEVKDPAAPPAFSPPSYSTVDIKERLLRQNSSGQSPSPVANTPSPETSPLKPVRASTVGN